MRRASLLSSNSSKAEQHRKVGLVLSGGAARGLAHVGVLSALEEHKIPVDLIVGASFGSIVAAYYAYGYSIEEMLEFARGFRLWAIRDFHPPWTSFFSGEEEEKIFERSIGDARIEDLRLPLVILAADLEREEPFLFERGKLSTALRASSAFIGLFDPLRFGDRLLVDGGIVGRQAVQITRERGIDVVVSSDVSVLSRIDRRRVVSAVLKWLARRAEKRAAARDKGTLPAVLHSVLRIIKRYHETGGEPPDFLIEPLGGEIRPLHFGKVDRCFRQGREAALEVMGDIKRMVFGVEDSGCEE